MAEGVLKVKTEAGWQEVALQFDRSGNSVDVAYTHTQSIAVDTAVVARKFTSLIGDGSTTAIAVTHSLSNQYVTVQVYDAASNAQVYPDVTLTSASVCTITFGSAPASNAYRVIVVG